MNIDNDGEHKPENLRAVVETENKIALIDKNFSLEPKTLDEAMKYAELIAKSSLVPEVFRNKPGDILIAVQMGHEVGLKPLQALQNIAVINGRPTLWGDAVLAIVRASGTLDFFEETWNDTSKAATCKAKRRGESNYIIRAFSMTDAENAGLAKKAGTWQSYPKRMCQMRARAFALRDGWADVLRGFAVAEEVMDYDTVKEPYRETVDAPTIAQPKRKSEAEPSNEQRQTAPVPEEAAPQPERIAPPPPPPPAATAPRTDRTDMKPMTARFLSKCPDCGGDIAKGSLIYYSSKTEKAYHHGPCF